MAYRSPINSMSMRPVIAHASSSDQPAANYTGGSNDYLRSLLMPGNSKLASIPDENLTPHVLKRILGTHNITGKSSYVFLYVPQNKGNQCYYGTIVTHPVLGTPTTGWIGALSPDEDVSENFARTRLVSSMLETFSNTLPSGAFAIQGNFNGAVFHALPDLAGLNPQALSPFNTVESVHNVPVQDGVVVVSLPEGPTKYAPNKTNAVSNTGSNCELTMVGDLDTNFFASGAVTGGTVVWSTRSLTGATEYAIPSAFNRVKVEANFAFTQTGGNIGDLVLSYHYIDASGVEQKVDVRTFTVFKATGVSNDRMVGNCDFIFDLPIVAERLSIAMDAGATFTGTLNAPLSHITVTLYDQFTDGVLTPTYIVSLTNFAADAMLTVNQVYNYEAVPTAELSKEVYAEPAAIKHHMDYIMAQAALRNSKVINPMYARSVYLNLCFGGAFDRVVERDNLQYASCSFFGDLWSGIKKGVSTMASVLPVAIQQVPQVLSAIQPITDALASGHDGYEYKRGPKIARCSSTEGETSTLSTNYAEDEEDPQVPAWSEVLVKVNTNMMEFCIEPDAAKQKIKDQARFSNERTGEYWVEVGLLTEICQRHAARCLTVASCSSKDEMSLDELAAQDREDTIADFKFLLEQVLQKLSSLLMRSMKIEARKVNFDAIEFTIGPYLRLADEALDFQEWCKSEEYWRSQFIHWTNVWLEKYGMVLRLIEGDPRDFDREWKLLEQNVGHSDECLSEELNENREFLPIDPLNFEYETFCGDSPIKMRFPKGVKPMDIEVSTEVEEKRRSIKSPPEGPFVPGDVPGDINGPKKTASCSSNEGDSLADKILNATDPFASDIEEEDENDIVEDFKHNEGETPTGLPRVGIAKVINLQTDGSRMKWNSAWNQGQQYIGRTSNVDKFLKENRPINEPLSAQLLPGVIGNGQNQTGIMIMLVESVVPIQNLPADEVNTLQYVTVNTGRGEIYVSSNIGSGSLAQVQLAYSLTDKTKVYVTAIPYHKEVTGIQASSNGLAALALAKGYPPLGVLSGVIDGDELKRSGSVVLKQIDDVDPKLMLVHQSGQPALFSHAAFPRPGILDNPNVKVEQFDFNITGLEDLVAFAWYVKASKIPDLTPAELDIVNIANEQQLKMLEILNSRVASGNPLSKAKAQLAIKRLLANIGGMHNRKKNKQENKAKQSLDLVEFAERLPNSESGLTLQQAIDKIQSKAGDRDTFLLGEKAAFERVLQYGKQHGGVTMRMANSVVQILNRVLSRERASKPKKGKKKPGLQSTDELLAKMRSAGLFKK